MFDFVINIVCQFVQLLLPLIGVRILIDFFRIMVFGKD